MSSVVMMLIGEKDVSEQITKPGLISDFMDLKIKHQKASEDFMDQKIKHQRMSANMFPASSTSLEVSTMSSMMTTNMSRYAWLLARQPQSPVSIDWRPHEWHTGSQAQSIDEKESGVVVYSLRYHTAMGKKEFFAFCSPFSLLAWGFV
ncbi:hypothetical protein BHE74_00004971 [Ensete ventricosum]|nr:hypothetical protein GW17_00003873 [Ensete ventricosum]RWW86260.1 hypothetical protein BHE74_00004971 [Ensete ventricosum]RZR82031.1 hypothetical protein BHM03_00008371 [Ensete ventricosum]